MRYQQKGLGLRDLGRRYSLREGVVLSWWKASVAFKQPSIGLIMQLEPVSKTKKQGLGKSPHSAWYPGARSGFRVEGSISLRDHP